MALLKHIASKNADYGEAQRSLMFQYDELTNKPVLDENGGLIPRKEYYMDRHNGSGNIHVHIVINSLRKYNVERQDFMERFPAPAPVRAKRTSTGCPAPCDSRAGYKRHVSKDY